MQPDSVGTEAGTAAVVSAIFFAFAAASIGNLLLSKFKLYIVLFVASALRGVAEALSAESIKHPSRSKYITYQTLDSVGYGASIAVLLLLIYSWLQTSEEPRPQHRRVWMVAARALLIPTAVSAFIIGPLAFVRLYRTDARPINQSGRKFELALYWMRTAVLAIWCCMLTVISISALNSYSAAVGRKGEVSAPAKSPSLRQFVLGQGFRNVDGRLLVHVIHVCTAFQIIGLAFLDISIYIKWFNRDHNRIPLQVLPQYLESLLLNIPSILPRLGRGPPREKERALNGSSASREPTGALAA